MINIKEVILGFIGLIIITYLPFAFVIGEWNPISWNTMFRALYVLSIVSIITFAFNEQKKK